MYRKICSSCVAFILPLRDENQLLLGFPPMYQNKLQEEGVQDVVNINKMKFTGIIKKAEPCKCDIRLASRIL